MASNPGVRNCLLRVQHTARGFSELLDETAIVRSLLLEAAGSVGSERAVLRLLAPDGDELRLAGAIGLSERYLNKGSVFASSSEIDRTVLGGDVVVIPDVAHDHGHAYTAQAEAEGLRGLLAVPLSVRQRVIGILRVYVDDTGLLTDDHRLLIATLCDLGALALEKARLHQLALQIGAALNHSLERGPMVDEVLRVTVEQMGLKAASVRLLDRGKGVLQLVGSHGLSKAYRTKGDVHLARSPVDQRACAGEVVVVRDLAHAQESGFEYPEEAASEGIHTVLVVPLRRRDEVVGVLRAYSGQPRPFGPVAVGFLSAVSEQVALALEKADLYEALRAKLEHAKEDLAEWYRFLALG